MIFGKQLQMTLCIHCGLKTLLESLYLSPFPRYTYIFCRISRWPPKMAGKRLWRTVADDSVYTLWVKNFVRIALSGTVSKIHTLFAEFQDGHQKWHESDFWQTVADDSVYTMGVKNFIGIAPSGTVSKIHDT